MKKYSLFIPLFLLTGILLAQPRPVQLSNTIIIDTDCGADDFRAISYLLARPEIKIEGIITSDGSVQPAEGVSKVASLLGQFGREDIQLAAGEAIKGINPPWREFNRNISWGEKPVSGNSQINAAEFLLSKLKENQDKITLVCLGPLTNVGKALKADGSILSKIDRIVWYNDAIKLNESFNYASDPKNAEAVLSSGIRMDLISGSGNGNSYFDAELAELSLNSKTPLALTIKSFFSQEEAAKRLKENHFRLFDDLVALYITTPDLFAINRDPSRRNVRYNSGFDPLGVHEVISDMIKGVYSPGRNVVFNGFPVNRELYTYDVRPLIDSAIARYGMEEWEANVMTDEFHGHLGVFSIVGAKMGIRAREFFGVGPDMLDVTTFAGLKPPYSCLTDGIQVSTGATLGMGTIHLGPDSIVKPSAIFRYENRAIRITLKKEYLEQVDRDINEGIVKFGLLDDGYWKLIRHNALKYWLEWDRKKIFELEVL